VHSSAAKTPTERGQNPVKEAPGGVSSEKKFGGLIGEKWKKGSQQESGTHLLTKGGKY